MRSRLVPTALALGVAAAGCAGGSAPKTHYYRLEPGQPAARSAPHFDGVLEVERLGATGLLQTRPIVKADASPPHALSQYSYHFWTEAPPEMLQHQLADYLRSANVARTVVTPELRVEPDFVVSGRLRRFEQLSLPGGSGVVVEMELNLSREHDDRLLWHETYTAERSASGPDVSSAVSSLGGALDEIYGRFVDDITSRSVSDERPVGATGP